MYRVGRLGLLLLAALARGGTLAAQAIPALDSAALAALIDSTPRIQVRLPTGWATLDGPRLQRDSLQFRHGTTHDRGGRLVALPSPLAFADVSEIRMAAGNGSAKGAAIGAGIGAGLGLLFAIAASSEPDCLGCPSDSEGFMAVPIVAALGAGVGALLGSGATRWGTVYRSSGPRPVERDPP